MKRIIFLIAVLIVLAGLGVGIQRIVHETVQTTMPGQSYIVSLGDSVAAGAGLSDTGGRKPGDCDVSEKAYPTLLGKQLHKSVEQFACSGATISAQTSANNLLKTQYKAAKQFLPDSDVVVYAGANDIGWLQLLSSCVQTDCATDDTSAALLAKLPTLQADMTALLTQLQQSAPHRIVVNTYYNLLEPTDTCFAGAGVTPDEVGFIAAQEGLFNTAIGLAATQLNIPTVAVDFSGHSLCSEQPWIQGVADRAPLHPNALGQQQIAAQDAAVLTSGR